MNKQETLEENSFTPLEKELIKKAKKVWQKSHPNPIEMTLFGAKWQQERSYSEKEIEMLLETLSKVLVYQGNEYILPHYFSGEIKKVIQQFKKK